MLRFQAEQSVLDCVGLGGRTLTPAEIARPGDLVAITPDSDDRRALLQRGAVLTLLDRKQRISYRLVASIPLTKAVEQIAASARAALPPWLAMALYGAARAWGAPRQRTSPRSRALWPSSRDASKITPAARAPTPADARTPIISPAGTVSSGIPSAAG